MSTDSLLRELDSIQVKAKGQQETLRAAGRMPPPSPLLEHLKETEGEEPTTVGRRGGGGDGFGGGGGGSLGGGGMAPQQAAMMQTAGAGPSLGGAASDGVVLRRRDDFGRFLEAQYGRSLGLILGVGRGDFALRTLRDWASCAALYLVDPYIHIWRGYDDPDNLSDKDHQLIFEDLRQMLAPYEGRHSVVRDFSHTFAETFRRGGMPALPTFIYIDANHAEAAVTRDIQTWWPLVASGGILAGSTYTDDNAGGRIGVRAAVDKFVSRQQLQVHLTQDDRVKSWFVVKP